MFDTNLVVVGNVLTAPEWRRLDNSGSLVANFRIASTARRFDRDRSQWVDGNSLRVRVTAWRRLAEGVASSIAVGDPVVVYGRLYCRDWQDEQGNNRVAYEMEAFSIGHDLARGRARFFRTRTAPLTSELESPEAEAFVRGETSVPLTADEAPVAYGDGLPDRLSEEEPTFADAAPGQSPVRVGASGQAAPQASSGQAAPHAASFGQGATEETVGEQATVPAPDSDSGSGSDSDSGSDSGSGSGSESPSETDDLTLEVERLVAEQERPASGRRRSRPAKREPVAA